MATATTEVTAYGYAYDNKTHVVVYSGGVETSLTTSSAKELIKELESAVAEAKRQRKLSKATQPAKVNKKAGK